MKIPPHLMVAVLVLLSACADRPMLTPLSGTFQPVAHTAPDTGTSWWYTRFRMSWPENAPPNWTADLMLADRIVKPALEAHRNGIRLWRVHRRAARDGTGHQFSFIFYSDAQTAADIYRQIETSRFLERLMNAGLVTRVLFDDTKSPRRPAVEDTSDPAWPVELQKAWPLYIMGVSGTWLDLVGQHAPSSDDRDKDITALLTVYRNADEKISRMWRHNAQHAYLHHLNALFGYQPMMLKKSIRF